MQVGIGTDSPKATLDVVSEPSNTSSFDGIIAPRITGDQLRVKSYTAEQTGAIVYVTVADTTPAGQTVDVKSMGYFFFDGTKWIRMDNNAWSIDGNAGTTAGTHFLGTTDEQNLVFKVNNVQSGLIEGIGGKINTSFGFNALNPLTTGKFNSAFGGHALRSNTTGGYNQAFGYSAMRENTTGRWNVAVGWNALSSSINGEGNTATGHLSMTNNISGTDNTALGYNSLNRNTTGNGNVALGQGASLYSTTGSYNIVIGSGAGTTGDANGNGALDTGSRNIIIGKDVSVPNINGDNQLNIGGTIFGTDISLSTGKIGIGVNNPTSTFEVNGTITNTNSFNIGNSRLISFSKSNFVYSQAPVGNYTINDVKDGGRYVLAVTNTTAGTATFTIAGFTVKTENTTITAGTETLYTINVIGTTAYISMVTGFL